MSATPRASQATSGDWTASLAVALLFWLACVGALALHKGGQVPSATAGLQSAIGNAWHALVLLVAGALFQSSTAALAPLNRIVRAVSLWAAWSGVSAALLLGPSRGGLDTPWPLATFLLQQLGLVAGLALGWFAPAERVAKLDLRLASTRSAVMALAALVTIAVICIPLGPDTPLRVASDAWQARPVSAYGKAVLGQIYALLKALILWVPLAMLFGFARRQRQLASWATTALLALTLLGPFLLLDLRIAEVVEILGAYWGVSLGLWISSNMEIADAVRVSAPAAGVAGSAPAAGQATTATPPSVSQAATARLASRLAAGALLIGSLTWAWSFPRWGYWLSACLLLNALLLARYRHAWLLIVPAALPLLNLAPGTGRFFLDEFDLLMLATVAMALWHGVRPAAQGVYAKPFLLAAGAFGMSWLISLGVGLFPLAPADANAFSSYWSSYNALRVGKSFFWAVALAAMLRSIATGDASRPMRLFLAGTLIGLTGVVAAGLWERALFADLFDLSARYRITATFGSMHMGGSDIEAYLALALPFAWLALWKGHAAAVRFGTAVLLALGAYTMALTVARGGVLALGVVFVLLALAGWRAQARRRKGPLLAASVLAISSVVLAIGLGGGFLQARFSSAVEDLRARANHWQMALNMRDSTPAAALFGMGLGRFPATYLYRSGASPPPGTYRVVDEQGNAFLRLGGGETLYMAQRVAVTAGQRYTLTLRARSAQSGVRLGAPICEKHLLNSVRCRWGVLSVPPDGQWHVITVVVDSDRVGEGNWLTRRSVELFFFNDSGGTVVDVDDVQLKDSSGGSFVRNGDFSAGTDYWFSKTHNHYAWHVDNLWISLLFEQGWLGLIAFVLLLVSVLPRLALAMWHGDRPAGALLAALGGFLTISVVGSPFDTPRIALLFFLLLILAGASIRSQAGATAGGAKRLNESDAEDGRRSTTNLP